MELKGSKTEGNLKAAFAGESQANRRYLYFAAKADVEGQLAFWLIPREPANSHSRRDTRVYRHVSRHGQIRARRRL